MSQAMGKVWPNICELYMYVDCFQVKIYGRHFSELVDTNFAL